MPYAASAGYSNIGENVKEQPPLLRITHDSRSRNFYNLAPGRAGSLQTAELMASLVRDAAVKDKALELEATRILTSNGLDSHSDPYEIADTLFRYVQRLHYIHDPAGAFDSVQSAQQVLREGKGDCDDLSVVLASLLAMVGFKPRFVLAKYKEETEGFDHVYVDLELPRGRIALDPTSRKHGIGWESGKAIERVAYPIFDGKVIGLGDISRKAKAFFSGFGGGANNCETGCGGCGVCNSAETATGSASGDTGLAANVTLSFPVVLFGAGLVLGALKVFDVIVSKEGRLYV